MVRNSKFLGVTLSALLASTLMMPASFADTLSVDKVSDKNSVVKEEAVKEVSISKNYQPVKAVQLVNSPESYLNKNVKITATFDKFSSLGLDYKPAFKDSQDYIGFLIKREGCENTIPLSELKLFLNRETAEKFIDLETGDKIEFKGTVFSTALSDPWVDVDNIVVLHSKSKKVCKEDSQDKKF